MEVSTETLVGMLREVEADDPIDYAALPFGEQVSRIHAVGSRYSAARRHPAVEAVRGKRHNHA
jgi:hypothetical protein